jgi:hypothetical protein
MTRALQKYALRHSVYFLSFINNSEPLKVTSNPISTSVTMQKDGTFVQYIYDQELSRIMTWKEHIYIILRCRLHYQPMLLISNIYYSKISHRQIFKDEIP